jgi:hypothetical protein
VIMILGQTFNQPDSSQSHSCKDGLFHYSGQTLGEQNPTNARDLLLHLRASVKMTRLP